MQRTRAVLLTLALAAGASPLGAQTTYDACYVPTVGAIYLIKQAGLPSACLGQAHVQFTWETGGSLADGSVTTVKIADGAVTPAKLSFNPATQPELNAVTAALAASGTINTTTNPVDWTQLKNVPVGFADGSDGGGLTDHGALSGLTDDDHSQYVLADGVRSATNGFALAGTVGVGTIPATGPGTRLMWYPGKAAFRAGWVFGSGWDDANVGSYSVAMVSGFASGANSVAIGNGATATGFSAAAFNASTRAEGDYSTAMGDGSEALGDYSVSMGNQTLTTAYASLAIGRYNVVTGSSTAWIATDPLLIAGNGGGSAATSNALTLLKNGNMTIAGTLTQSSDLRYKEAIEPLDSALTGVLRLAPIYYRFRENTGHPTERRIGLGAQDVERIFPELVHRDSQGYLSVAYTDLAAVLVRAVQEQQALQETLRAEVAALRAELAALRAATAAGGSK